MTSSYVRKVVVWLPPIHASEFDERLKLAGPTSHMSIGINNFPRPKVSYDGALVTLQICVVI